MNGIRDEYRWRLDNAGTWEHGIVQEWFDGYEGPKSVEQDSHGMFCARVGFNVCSDSGIVGADVTVRCFDRDKALAGLYLAVGRPPE